MLPEFASARIVDINRLEVVGKGNGAFSGGYELLEEHSLVQVGHIGAYCAPARADLVIHVGDTVISSGRGLRCVAFR